ncbi:hypothetical protein F2P81_008458 [Scophthalmus maximus]|uniref:Uncharacterized protein n=1 Tax=Scophthalmus maximus TaxID=52904 RepID=A0A6A4T2D4_SCOMX|nr:hypothetical protein F2P81_008458 [Scophthalmus maximus]
MRSRTPRKPAEKRSFLFCPDAPVTLRYRGATGGTGRDDTYADFVSVCAVVCMESFQHCGGVHRPHREPPGDVTLPLAATVGDLRLVNSGSEAPLVSRLRVSVELQRSLPQRRETITVSTVKVPQTAALPPGCSRCIYSCAVSMLRSHMLYRIRRRRSGSSFRHEPV